ncbi:hypothetical protein B6K86_04280 [Lachnospiraceae bacterium]|nr:hypothetical protein B6K86_04280 [Lachnospiraceae bacterium]
MKKAVFLYFFYRSKNHRFYDFLFNFDSRNIPFVSVVKYFYLQEFLHQGFFLKSSKLVVNSTCSLANILVFQGV